MFLSPRALRGQLQAMDVERLELYVEQCPCQGLRVQDEEGVFFLGKSHAKSRWYVIFKPNWDSSPTTFEKTRLQDIITLIERMYPELYTWLASRFPEVSSVRGLNE